MQKIQHRQMKHQQILRDEEDSETSAQPYEDTAIDTTDIYD